MKSLSRLLTRLRLPMKSYMREDEEPIGGTAIVPVAMKLLLSYYSCVLRGCYTVKDQLLYRDCGR